MTQPRVWTNADLVGDSAKASSLFREERLAVAGDWERHYRSARATFNALFKELGDLRPESINDDSLASVIGNGLGDALRYLAGPPVSDDDLRVIADVSSMTPSVLATDLVSLRKVFEVIERVIDPFRFPWVKAKRAPTAKERDAALLASSVLLAAQRIATERRSDVKENQEGSVKDYLRRIGFHEVNPVEITTIVHGPQADQFCGECLLGERKSDLVIRLHDTRLMAIECKVSNSALNSVKRLNNDAAVKAKYWIGQFGTAQVVPAAMLSGVFKVLNLEQAQASGLSIFWGHDLEKLGQFIESTKPTGKARGRTREKASK